MVLNLLNATSCCLTLNKEEFELIWNDVILKHSNCKEILGATIVNKLSFNNYITANKNMKTISRI